MSQQINLFNPIFLKQKKYFSATTMAQALGLILLGGVGLSVFADYQIRRLGEDAKSAAAQRATVEEQLKQVSAIYQPREKTKALEENVLQAEADVRSLQQVAETLKNTEFSNTKGYAEHMRAFSRQIVNGLWLTGFTIDGTGNQIGLMGRALKAELVPSYINRLKNEPVLQGKSFAALEIHAGMNTQDGKAEPGAEKPEEFAPYIEFSLRSSTAQTGMQADASGAKSK